MASPQIRESGGWINVRVRPAARDCGAVASASSCPDQGEQFGSAGPESAQEMRIDTLADLRRRIGQVPPRWAGRRVRQRRRRRGSGITAVMPLERSTARVAREEYALSPRNAWGVVRGRPGPCRGTRSSASTTSAPGSHRPGRASRPAPMAARGRRRSRGSWSSTRHGTDRWRDRPVRPCYSADPCRSTGPPVYDVGFDSDLAAVAPC